MQGKRLRDPSNPPTVMNRNPPVDQRSNFIAEYAAKKQSQMDRAKQLREQRTGGGGGSALPSQPPTPLNPQSSNTYDQQQHHRSSAASFEDLPARPQQLKAPTSITSNHYSQQPAPQQYYSTNQYEQPSVASHHAPSMDYPPSLRQAPQGSAYSTAGSSNTFGRSAIEVTETHFREATQRGIITSDQARQLWAVLSDQAILVKGTDSCRGPSDARSARQPPPSDANAQQFYNPSQYAAPTGSRGGTAESQNSNATYRGSYAHHQLAGQLDDDEDYPQMDYGQPSKVSKSLASRVAKSKKPEWNNDYNEEVADAREAPPVQPARAAPKAVVKRRPEWNDDGDVNYAEPEPPAAPKATPKANAQRAPAARSRFDEEEASMPLDRAFPSRQKKPEQQQQQQPAPMQRQQQQDQPPQSSGRQPVAANRRVPVSTRGGKAPPPIPEPTGPVEQDEEEVDYFLRQKEEAKRQFEEALADADRSEPLEECNICGRNFRLSILARHEKACKVAGKKRRVFDSKKNRLEGIDGIDEVLAQAPVARRGAATGAKAGAMAGRAGATAGPTAPPSRGGNADKPMPANAMPKWKLQHQQFQIALQAIKHAANPSAAPPPPMPESLDDRVPCPHCSRRFARDTADRHIPSCAKTVNKPKGLLRPGPGLARR
jgi:hypothetical protein